MQVRNIDGVQGKEYRALILSTVRTCVVEPNEGEESSFLSNPKVRMYVVHFIYICIICILYVYCVRTYICTVRMYACPDGHL